MWWTGGGSRLALDYGFAGAVIGFVVSVITFALLMAASLRIDRSEAANDNMGCSCLLKLAALLVLTLGLGAGYMIGRSLSG